MCTLIQYLHFMGTFFFFFNPSLLLSWMFEHDWTHAVLGVFYAYVLYFCICTCSAQLSMFHMERRSRNMLIINSLCSEVIPGFHIDRPLLNTKPSAGLFVWYIHIFAVQSTHMSTEQKPV